MPGPTKPPGPASIPGAELEARRTQRLRTAEALRPARTPLAVIETAADAAQRAEEAADNARPPRPPALACKEGCDWCCHKVVGTAPPEVFRIVAYLRDRFTADEQAAVLERARQRAARRLALSQDRWAAVRLPCPLLVDGRCSVYEVRPLTCRGFTSTDAHACERSATTRTPVSVPRDEGRQRIATFVLDGLRAGLAQVGLPPGELLDLSAALEIALAEPAACERWLAGEALFRRAELPPGP